MTRKYNESTHQYAVPAVGRDNGLTCAGQAEKEKAKVSVRSGQKFPSHDPGITLLRSFPIQHEIYRHVAHRLNIGAHALPSPIDEGKTEVPVHTLSTGNSPEERPISMTLTTGDVITNMQVTTERTSTPREDFLTTASPPTFPWVEGWQNLLIQTIYPMATITTT